MNVLTEEVIASFKDAARKLVGAKRRAFQAQVTLDYLDGSVWKAERVFGRAYAPLFQGLRTTFSCVFVGFSRELSSHYIINTNCNGLYSQIHYRKVANM